MRRLGSGYALERIVGRGGTGEVWRAHDDGGGSVAVKILRPEFVADDHVVTRFVRERDVLRSVRNPHVVGVRDLVVEGDTVAIVMDYVEHSDLRAFIQDQGGALAPAVAVRFAREMLDALAAVHGAGVVHRDVKPENVLVDIGGDGQPIAKLSDFGISRLVDAATVTRITGLIGTPRYMAPELGTGSDPTPASDVYSVGIVLYELLTGRPPFVGDHPVAVLRAHAQQRVRRPRAIPRSLWAVLSRLLAKDPDARYPDAAAAAAALAAVEPALVGLPPLVTTPANGADTVTPPRRHTTFVEEANGSRAHRTDSNRSISGRVLSLDLPPRARRSVLLGGAFACIASLIIFVGPVALRSQSQPKSVERAWLDSYDGYVVRREWKLTGAHGNEFRATEVIMVTDARLKANTRYLDVIPKSLAARDTDIDFAGIPPQVVQKDPVFNIPLMNASRGTFGNLSYSIRVGNGARSASRLDQWNADLISARKNLHATNPEVQVPKTSKSVAANPSLTDPSGNTNQITQVASKTTQTPPAALLQLVVGLVNPAAPTTVITDPTPPVITTPGDGTSSTTTTTAAPPPTTTTTAAPPTTTTVPVTTTTTTTVPTTTTTTIDTSTTTTTTTTTSTPPVSSGSTSTPPSS